MKHAEIGVNGAYHTSDLYVAAWLLTKGLELQDIDRRNSRRCDFIFNLRRAIGRKRYDVPFAIVCKALQACCGNYSAAARWIFEESGIKVSPGFVQTRVQREDKTLGDIFGQPLQSLAPKSGQKQLAKEG